MPTRMLVRRLLSPVGFVLAGACFLLPALAASWQAPAEADAPGVEQRVIAVHASYSGVDLALGGPAERSIRVRLWDQTQRAYIERDIALGTAEGEGLPNVRLPGQIWAVVAGLLVLVGVAAELLVGAIARARTRLIVAVAAAGALVVAVVEGRGELATVAARVLPPYTGGPLNPDELARHIRPGYGFWLVLGLLVAIVVGNAWTASGRPVRRAPIGAGTLDRRDDH